MRTQLLQPIGERRMHPFLTKDAKKVYDKTIQKISTFFANQQTRIILDRFIHLDFDKKDTSFSDLATNLPQESHFLIQDKTKVNKLPYSVLVVTENEELYKKFQSMQLFAKLLTPESKLDFVTDYDILHVIDCYTHEYALAQFQNVLVYDNPDLVYPERHLKTLAQYAPSLQRLLEEIVSYDSQLATELQKCLELLELGNSFSVDSVKPKEICDSVNERIAAKLDSVHISASELLFFQNSKQMPATIQNIIHEELESCELPLNCFNIGLPLTLNMQVANC